jgi:hypothetical protein
MRTTSLLRCEQPNKMSGERGGRQAEYSTSVGESKAFLVSPNEPASFHPVRQASHGLPIVSQDQRVSRPEDQPIDLITVLADLFEHGVYPLLCAGSFEVGSQDHVAGGRCVTHKPERLRARQRRTGQSRKQREVRHEVFLNLARFLRT